MGAMSVTHWLIVVLVVVLLFGAKKIPDAARGLGQSMRILKAELAADDRSTNTAHATPPSPTPPHHDQLTVKPPREYDSGPKS